MKSSAHRCLVQLSWYRFTTAAGVALLALAWTSEAGAQGHVVDFMITPLDPIANTGSRLVGTGDVVGPLLGNEPPFVNDSPLVPQSTNSSRAGLSGSIRAFVGFDPMTGDIATINFMESMTSIDFNDAVDSGGNLISMFPGVWVPGAINPYGDEADQIDTGPDGIPGTMDDVHAPNMDGASRNSSSVRINNGPDGVAGTSDDEYTQGGTFGFNWPPPAGAPVSLETDHGNMGWTLLGGAAVANVALRDISLTFAGNIHNNIVGVAGSIAGTSTMKFSDGFTQISSEMMQMDSNLFTPDAVRRFELDGSLIQPIPVGDDISIDAVIQQQPLRSDYPARIPWRTFLGWDSNGDGIPDGAANTATDDLVFANDLRPAYAGWPQKNVPMPARLQPGVDGMDNPGFMAPITSGLTIPTDGLASQFMNGDLVFDVEVIDIGFDGIKGTADDVNLSGGAVTVTIPQAALADNDMVINVMGNVVPAAPRHAADNLKADFNAALAAAGLKPGGGVPDIVNASNPDVDDDGALVEDYRLTLTSDSVAFGIDITISNVNAQLTTVLGYDTGAVADPDLGDTPLETGTNSHTFVGSAQPKIILDANRQTLDAELINESVMGSSILDLDPDPAVADLMLTLDWDSTLGFATGDSFFISLSLQGNIVSGYNLEYTPWPGDATPEGGGGGGVGVNALAPADVGVDAGDYTTWANNFGLGSGLAHASGIFATYLEGEWNGDGIVDAADYTIWANNFGLTGVPTGPVSSVPASVPEPSSLILLSAGGLVLALARRRRNRRRAAMSA